MIKTRWSCRWITSQQCSPSTPQFSSLSGPARNHQLLSGFFLVISIISPTYKQFHDRSRCHLELELHSDQFGFSVFTEEMNFEQTKGCDRDYYQFGRDFLVFTSHKGPKRCGKWDPARRVLRDDGSFLRLDYGKTPRSRREYVEDVDKEMDLWLVVHPSKKWVFYSNGLNILSLW